jgi:hypothetical protein
VTVLDHRPIRNLDTIRASGHDKLHDGMTHEEFFLEGDSYGDGNNTGTSLIQYFLSTTTPSVMDERHEEIRSESISGDHLYEKPVIRQLGSFLLKAPNPCEEPYAIFRRSVGNAHFENCTLGNSVHEPECRVRLSFPRQPDLELAFRGRQPDPYNTGVRIFLL